MIKPTVALLSSSILWSSASANNRDLFNFGYTNSPVPGGGGTDYGQRNWGSVTCDDLGSCTGYPDKFEESIGWTIAGPNNCRWCPEDGAETCGLHRQSPIDLKRDRAIIGSPNEKECIDWHFMQYRDDTCSWSDMVDQFSIERHALKLSIPTTPSGDIDCVDADGLRQYARLDFSKGYPDWWWLDHTSIHVPSHHTQEGKRYDAEVVLAHFYEIAHPKNQLGQVSIFLEAYEDAESWAYLDKLICQWRRVEEEVRASCGLDPAPAYGRCALFRGQDPPEEPDDILFPDNVDVIDEPTTPPTPAPIDTSAPTATASDNPSAGPTDASVSTGTPSESATATPRGYPGNPIRNIPGHTIIRPAPVQPPTSAPIGNVTTDLPTASPTTAAPIVSNVTSAAPSASPVVSNATMGSGNGTLDGVENGTSATPYDGIVPPEIDCSAYEPLGANYARMCQSNVPCCNPKRSDTDFCWNYYENIFPGDTIYSACYHCCPGEPLRIGPPAPDLPDMPKTIQCANVPNPYRICKPGSCCSSPRSTTGYCRSIYAQFGDDMAQLCHYCCDEPREVGPALTRNLLGNETDDSSESAAEEPQDESSSAAGEHEAHDQVSVEDMLFEARALHDGDKDELPKGAKVTYLNGRKILLRKENFEEDTRDEQEYFEQMYSDFQRRQTQSVHEVDYDDVEYWPYEWLLKVGTEYYYRYEGTQVVPPCWEVVHWRTLKDPIRVHPRQIAELNRLLAWRLSPSGANRCEVDTAGVLSPDGNTVDLSRDIQYIHLQHRMVFCECQDWPSKFPSDQEWCKDWKNDPGQKRFYGTPYSFDTNGEW